MDASRVSLLVLVDAADGVPAGEVVVRELVPWGRGGDADGGQAGRIVEGGPPMTHHVDPESLLALAHELWGAAPRTVLVGIGPASLELGDRLTPQIETAIPHAVEAVVAAVAGGGAVAGVMSNRSAGEG